MIRILHVEDEPMKARIVDRLIRHVAGRAGVELEVAHVASLIDLPRSGSFDGVVSDWQLPICPGEAVHDHGGWRVVSWAEARGIPVAVISGSDRPQRWVDGPDARWAPAGEWLPAVEWLVESVVAQAERAGAA